MDTYNHNTLEGEVLTVAQLAVRQPGALSVFNKYQIDYCCGGHRSLEEACHRIGVDPEKVRAEINESSWPDRGFSVRPEHWSASLLIDFIIENHHGYCKVAIPQVESLLEKVCARHGDDAQELLYIQQCFLELSTDLIAHMQKEEFVVFPTIRKLAAAYDGDHALEKMIQTPIQVMEDEHQAAGDLIKQIRKLSNHYTPPEFACPTFRVTYQKLKEFDDDLMRHIHLENNILFERFKSAGASTANTVL